MRGKNKSFIEDTIILFVIGIIIYAVYSFFFASDEEVEIQNEPAVVERNVSTDSQVDKDSINNEKVADEKINEDIIQTQREKPVQIEEETKDIIEAIPDDKIEVKKEITKEVKETETPNLSEITDIEIFYKSIEDKIYANIESNVDKTLIKDNAFVNIRVTILKDGRYEQLIMTKGDEEFFNSIKSSILEVFPLEINQNLKNIFPRYYRLTIELN